MGYKNVCINCKRVESLGTDHDNFRTGNYPECSNEMIFVNHKFRPPKKTDAKAWKVVSFLIINGFEFQPITDDSGCYIKYPESMKEAESFVTKYREKIKR